MKAAALLALAALLAVAAPAGAGSLHEAARVGDAAAIAKLLQGGAVVHEQDATGNTPLHSAAAHGHVSAIARLLAAGADVNVQNKEGLTPLQLAVENGHDEARMALRSHIASISTIRSGIYTDTTCSNPRLLWIYVPDITIDIDRGTADGSVSVGFLQPDSGPLAHGWQRFRLEYSPDETYGYFLRMAAGDGVQWVWWDPGSGKVREPPRGDWTKMLPSSDADAGEHWELVTYTRCDSIPFPLSMLHGEPAAFLFSLEPAIRSCRNGNPSCIPLAFGALDIHEDGALSTAEWARLIRVTLYFSLAYGEQRETGRLGATYAISVLAAPLAASALVSSYDYDGDGKTSLEELLHAIEGQGAGSIPEIEGLDPEMRRKLEEAITVLRGLSGQLPGLK